MLGEVFRKQENHLLIADAKITWAIGMAQERKRSEWRNIPKEKLTHLEICWVMGEKRSQHDDRDPKGILHMQVVYH